MVIVKITIEQPTTGTADCTDLEGLRNLLPDEKYLSDIKKDKKLQKWKRKMRSMNK